jgi:hypothetical protein
MRSTKAVVAAGTTAICLLTAQGASAAVRIDQRCLPKRGRYEAYTGVTLSQSFRPAGKAVTGIDFLLMARQEQGLDTVRVRFVGRRTVVDDDAGKMTAQIVVLAERSVQFTMRAWAPTWLGVRLPKPVLWADAGPAVDEYAVEVAWSSANETLGWVACAGYAKGEAAATADPGAAAGTDSKTAVTQTIGRDLSFVLYTTR